ncbi:hypothetical protein CU669_11220 [Paramagnetospirillum kuznetsovii]|uniref:SGNH hydrolase-type esterase domain-containing protein n=1 Tax=Paramagnetospirillum kuznetsovii TaxID=2053833 RepID=A0A364NY79_9PROT|nr:GDSL-type esterase/lipase family protein [Paramagnetospirillum kuznetsovii]RAU21867.1 hypothetical protein CU669_11220 [Paramagnetospirillum kuznetsovii]
MRTKLIGWAVILAIVMLGVELVARLIEAGREQLIAIPAIAKAINETMVLDPYKVASDRYGGHWGLKPGYTADSQELVAAKLAVGKVEGGIAIATVPTGRLAINSQGFKGQEIDLGHRLRRILFLGDSVTFGLPGVDYVSLYQENLAARGRLVEAINGGVEGYWLRNHLLEINRYIALKPDIVVIFAGWNDIYGEYPPALSSSFATIRLLEQVGRLLARLGSDDKTRARALLNKRKRLDPTDPILGRLQHDTPLFLERTKQLGDSLSKNGARVVLATLPGLYMPDQIPDGATLAKGHLPQWTDNPLALAIVTDRANQNLRELAVSRGWKLLDLEAWSREALVPRDRYFVDSVHLTADGYRLMGRHLADSLSP